MLRQQLQAEDSVDIHVIVAPTAYLHTVQVYHIFSIKCPRHIQVFQNRQSGHCIYLKPAFNRALVFINKVQFPFFQVDLLLPIIKFVHVGRFLPLSHPNKLPLGL